MRNYSWHNLEILDRQISPGTLEQGSIPALIGTTNITAKFNDEEGQPVFTLPLTHVVSPNSKPWALLGRPETGKKASISGQGCVIDKLKFLHISMIVK